MDKFSKAKIIATKILNSPILSTIPIHFVDAETSYTDGKSIFIAKQHTKKLDEFVYTLVHEALHIMMHHLPRYHRFIVPVDEKPNMLLYNLAADAVLDRIIKERCRSDSSSVIQSVVKYCDAYNIVKNLLSDIDIDSSSVEEIYRLLKKRKVKLVTWYKPGSGKHDLKIDKNFSVEEIDLSQYAAERELFKEAYAKKAGTKSKGLQAELDIVDGAKIDLVKHLKHLSKSYASGYDDLTFMKISRINLIYPNLKLAIPKWISRKANVVISVDTSASISNKQYLDAVSIILHNAHKINVDIVLVDSDITSVFESVDRDFEISQLKQFLKQRKGFGGTCVAPVIKWIESRKKHYDVWFHISADLEIYDLDSARHPRNTKSVFWITELTPFTRNQEVPFGRKLFY